MTEYGANRFRTTLVAIAIILAAFAAWILAPQFVERKTIEYPLAPELAASISAQRNDFVLAARIGGIRGDLWSEAAIAQDAIVSLSKSGTATVGISQTRELAERAVRMAPHDSRTWVLLAASDFRLGKLDEVASALRMSYYTGANIVELVPGRLALALQIQAIQDSDFRELVRHDIEVAAVRKSELGSALLAEYKSAPPPGRELIEKTLAELDPALLASIRAGLH
ncbi:MAG TPA: hypothetical protein VMT22_20975 [Terriglobales bacterium]|nr:hypothetical protein [Terriglobales bacterium]